MAVSAFRAPLLVLALGGCAAAAGDRGTARLVDRVWLDIGGDAAPGSFRAFLSDGTLFYYLTIAPEKDAQSLQEAFQRIGDSIRLTEAR